jgi:hypothetical protein
VAAGLAARKEDEIRVESELDDVAERHPAVGETHARGARKRRHEAPMAGKVHDARAPRRGAERGDRCVVACDHPRAVACGDRADLFVDQRRVGIGHTDDERLAVQALACGHAGDRCARREMQLELLDELLPAVVEKGERQRVQRAEWSEHEPRRARGDRRVRLEHRRHDARMQRTRERLERD